jgi:hypothetical protein
MTPGGENYKISVNGKAVVEQFVTQKSALPTFQLTNYKAEDEISVYYNHCGKIGTSRSLSLLDDDRVIKFWKFDDSSGDHMKLKISDIAAFSNSKSTLKLSYKSNELTEGRALASVTFAASSASRLK